jgi:enterochelin esterase-like enzyme
MPRAWDRVKDTTTTTGTGAITLSGTPPTGYQAFATAFQVGDQFGYAIVAQSGGLWETGIGYLSASTTLVRDTVEDGSSGKATAVSLTAGTYDVFCTALAHWLMDGNSGALLAKAKGCAMP